MEKNALLYIGNNLAAKGGNITTIDTLSQLLRDEGFSVITASSRKNKLLRFLDMAWVSWTKTKGVSAVLIDTYSTQNFRYATMVGRICRIKNVPYIPILHGGNLPKRLRNSPRSSRKLFGNALVNVAPSNYILEHFQAAGFTNLKLIPNSVEIDQYPFLLRKTIRPKILWVRSFAEIYNPLLAIKTLEKLKGRYPEATLCMVGPDKDGSMQRCKTYAEEKQLSVQFTGMLSKESWIALSSEYDIFLNTTNFDNMPVSVIEAMALGLPVVSTNVGGLPYLIEDNVTGMLVNPKDENLLSSAILSLLENPILTEELSRKARTKAETFSWRNISKQWMSLLNQ